MATVYVASASIDENGKAHGGAAGNQTGKELKKQKWYLHSKGWRVFRARAAEAAEKIAACMEAAVANRHIGYDQYQRNTLYAEAEKFGFDVSRVTKDVECDCSALVRVCCAYAGILGLPSDFRTGNMPKNLMNTGAFKEMAGDKYTRKSDYLKRGDILVTATSGHTVVVLNDGPKAEIEGTGEAAGLGVGDYGTAVKAMQEALLRWKQDCLPKYGADGDFGSETEGAVKAFQAAAGLPVTGVYDEATRQALTQGTGNREQATGGDGEIGNRETSSVPADGGATFPMGEGSGAPEPAPQMVEITGGSVNVRSAPGTEGTRVLGVVYRGDRLAYQGESRDVGGRAWYRVSYRDQSAWVSSLYARLV